MSSSDTPADLHTMGAVRRLTGLTDRQIRYYGQCGLVHPRRTAGGHRVFTTAEVGRLALIRQLLAQGLTVAEVATRLPALPPAPPA